MEWIEVFVSTSQMGLEPVEGVLYECGLTGLMIHDENDFEKIGKIVQGVDNYYLQKFEDKNGCIAEGWLSPVPIEIAENMHISIRTVKTHIQHMRDKTGFRNRTELAVQARAKGLIINEN